MTPLLTTCFQCLIDNEYAKETAMDYSVGGEWQLQCIAGDFRKPRWFIISYFHISYLYYGWEWVQQVYFKLNDAFPMMWHTNMFLDNLIIHYLIIINYD